MKHFYYLIIALLLAPSSCFAWGVMSVGGGGSSSAACSTPATGDTLNEGFIGTGYENTWVEDIGTTGVIDEDYTLSGTPPDNSCTEGLLTSVATNGGVTYSYWDNGSAIAVATNIDIKFELRISSVTLPVSGDAITIGGMSATLVSSGTVQLRIDYDGSNYNLRGAGISQSTRAVISLNTWYTVTLHGDTTDTSSYFMIDEVATCDAVAECTFQRSTGDYQYFRIGPRGLLDADEAVEIEWGRVWIDLP